MYLDHYSLSIPAESKEQALEKIKENLEEEDMDFFKLDVNPSLTETELNTKEATIQFVVSEENSIWNSIQLGFSASKSDRKTAKSIYEILNGSLEEQAKSFKVDDRGRITLGSSYSEKDEVNVLVIEDE